MPVLSPSSIQPGIGGEITMTDGSLHSPEQSRSGTHLLDRALCGLVWRRLERLEIGRLVIDDGGERREFGRAGGDALAANIEIRDPRFYRHLV